MSGWVMILFVTASSFVHLVQALRISVLSDRIQMIEQARRLPR